MNRRLAVYREQTEPLEGFYAERGLLREVDAEAPAAEVTERTLERSRTSRRRRMIDPQVAARSSRRCAGRAHRRRRRSTRVVAAVAPGVTHRSTSTGRRGATSRSRARVPSFKGYRRAPFPATICASINDEIVHGIPSADRVLAEGDLVSLDFGAIWEGFHADSAVTVFVGAPPPSDDAKRLVEDDRGGARRRDRDDPSRGPALATSATRSSRSRGAGLGVVREYGGHGIGRAMHEDPFIQNWGRPGRGPELRPGLVSRSSRC